MSFAEMVTGSVLLRALAIVIVALTVIAAIITGMVELLAGQAINPVIWTIVGTGVVQALAVLNINYGVVLQPVPSPTKAPVTTPAQNTTTP